MNAVIIGGGAYGTALACTVAHCAEVTILVRSEDQATAINNEHRNIKYLPDFRISEKIQASCNFESVSSADVVFLATPAHSIDGICTEIKSHLRPNTIIVNLAKGLHIEHFTLDKAINHHLPGQIVASLKGPNFARPLLQGAPSGMTLAITQPERMNCVRQLFNKSAVSVEEWSDIGAVEFISAVKNVFATIMGICDATEDNPNTRFMVVQRLLKEASLLLETFGYHPGVLLTFAGCGDLLMTALNDSSRNRTLGLLIGRGFEFSTSGRGPVLEGRRTIGLINRRLTDSKEKHSMLFALEDVFEKKLSPQEFFRQLTQSRDCNRVTF